MLKERSRLIASVLLVIDLAGVAAAFFVAYWLRDSVVPALGLRPRHLYPLSLYLPLLPLILALWGVLLSRLGAYRSHRTISLLDEAWSILRVSALGAILLVLCIYLFRLDAALLGDDQISRIWIVLVAFGATAFVLAGRTAVRLLSRYVRARGYNYRTLLVVGTGPAAQSLVESIERHGYWGYRVLGFVRAEDDAEAPPGELAHPVLGTLADIPAIIEREVVDEVVFAVRRAELDRLEDLFLQLEEQGVLVRLALDVFPHTRARVEVGDLEGVPLLTFSRAPSSPALLAVKRMVDLALSLVLCAAALPVMAAIALAIRLTSGGEVLFRQTRCGLNGRRFTLYKFRTMVEDAESRRPDLGHLNEMDGPVFKVRSDPRVTRLGRLLRRYSLDELPQLWNVLAGSMSLVGPRPAIPEEVAQYQRWQRRRLSMRPGLTCLWQISGRSDVDFERWMQLDLEYIDSWSPLLDLKILARTVPVVLSGRGAF
ncbi:MAG: sugar transferase [Acidobacteriota bacterium]|nr:sugar transferase [Acidobacteriota bacterium]